MLLSTACGWIGLLFSPAVAGVGSASVALLRAVLLTLVLGGLCLFLWRSALRNYLRHIEKMCTLLAMALSGAAKAHGTGPAGAVDV